MKMLSGLDGVFLHLETPAMPMHVGSLRLLEPPSGLRGGFLDRVRRLYERRLHLAPVVSRKRLEFPLGMANPVWVQVPAVDLDCHIRLMRAVRRDTKCAAAGTAATAPTHPGRGSTGRHGMARIGLATRFADPLRRPRAIRDASAAAETRVSGGQSVARMDFPTIGVPWLLHGPATLYGRPSVANRVPPPVNVVISNVPGPPQPLYLAGARVLHHWPLSIVGHGLGLNITVERDAGMRDFGITTVSVAVARPRSVADALVASFRQLQARTRRG